MVEGKGRSSKVGYLTTGPAGPRYVDLEARAEAMAEQGVAMHALSLSQPMTYWAAPISRSALTETFNDELARAHEDDPARFVGLATQPASARTGPCEVEAAARLPGVRGFLPATRVSDRELSDPAFFPVYERIAALKLPVFLHPIYVIDHQRLTRTTSPTCCRAIPSKARSPPPT